jgi:hypothetical protein
MRVPEEQVIAAPMNDPRFAAFYAAERGNFAIGWNIGHELPPDVGAQCLVQRTPNGGWMRAVLLRNMPTVEEAKTIAHEITHFVLWNAGFPYAWVTNPNLDDALIERVAMIANFPTDLLIEHHLACYGFPLRPIGPGAADTISLCYKRGFQTPMQMRLLIEHLLDHEGLLRVAVVE